jgi:hypothetical protein
MKKNQNIPGLAQEIGFGSVKLLSLWWLAGKWRRCAVHCRKECNKYDLTTVQCFLLAHHNDWSR